LRLRKTCLHLARWNLGDDPSPIRIFIPDASPPPVEPSHFHRNACLVVRVYRALSASSRRLVAFHRGHCLPTEQLGLQFRYEQVRVTAASHEFTAPGEGLRGTRSRAAVLSGRSGRGYAGVTILHVEKMERQERGQPSIRGDCLAGDACPLLPDLASLVVLEALKGLLLRDLWQVASLQVEEVFAETPKVTVTIRPL
jgi:hypothetical protein